MARGKSMNEINARKALEAQNQNNEEATNMENTENTGAQENGQDVEICHNQEKNVSPADAIPNAPKAKKVEPHECRCGCGTIITSKGAWVAGHDAQYRAKLVSAAVAGCDDAKNALNELGWLDAYTRKLEILNRPKAVGATNKPKMVKTKIVDWRVGLVIETAGRYAMVTGVNLADVELSDGTYADKTACRVLAFDFKRMKAAPVEQDAE